MFATTDVLIAGAGPVGLMLAAELRRDGVKTCIIDAHDERTFFVKALGVTARTLEIFEDVGMVRDAIDAGVWLTSADTFQDGAPSFSMQIPRDGMPYGALSLAQFETERILEGLLARHGGHVQYGATLLDFTESADAVDARIQDTSGDIRTVRCRWLVGCDGARSTVRRHLNVAFEGDRFPQTFMLADLDVDWNLPRGAMYRFNVSDVDGAGATSLAALPVRGSARRYRLSMILRPDDAARHALNSTPDFAEVERIMLPILPKGARLSSMRWSSVYRVSHRIAQHYARGRVFLAGDAAHIHPPVGGQGMNTGLQDAHNLAWKLVLAVRGAASASLLDSYEAERRPVGLDVVESTSRAMNTVLAHGEVRPAMRETQLLIGYRGSPIVADECTGMAPDLPAPGDRVPQVGGLVQAFVGHAQRLQEHIGRGRHTLVTYIDDDTGGARTAAFDAAVEAWLAALGVGASAVRIVSSGVEPSAAFAASGEAYRTLVDRQGEFAAAFGARNGMLWIVRPDGHIGYRSASCSARDSIAWLDSVLGR
ncbi:monooxygenase FAD-binding protein [Caballeronia hypogeia]|uniref:Monooxygenase FAD-binding protein n=1 Tax=Caballeronia hypogeia TaxID=1777140 RepID=A0A158AD36_9BURK|nr:FAD-dependent monooxygenase [Caballeronia hypogeia]SAK55670.1 monooxygenase FAD-binding protein [Caballeronia hypogeia]